MWGATRASSWRGLKVRQGAWTARGYVFRLVIQSFSYYNYAHGDCKASDLLVSDVGCCLGGRFLWSEYEDAYFWYELVELAKKLALTNFVLFINFGSGSDKPPPDPRRAIPPGPA